MNKIFIALIASLVLVFGCVSPTDHRTKDSPDPVVLGEGKFGVQKVTGTTALNQSVGLGTYTINDSQTIFFILKNVGGRDITNVTLAVSNTVGLNGADVSQYSDNFNILPDTTVSGITLQPFATSSVDTLVSIQVNHGDQYNSVGLTSYIDPSFLGMTIHITGTTTNAEGVESTINEDVDIGTLVNLARFEIQTSSDGTTWETITNWVSDTTGMGVYVPAIYPDGISPDGWTMTASSGKSFRILNTGNVPFKVSVGQSEGTKWGDYTTVAVGEFKSIPRQTMAYNCNMVRVNTLGKQYDNSLTYNDADSATPLLNFTPSTSVLEFMVEGL